MSDEYSDLPGVDDGTAVREQLYAPTDIPGELLDQTHRTYQHWLGDDYDLEVLDVVLAAVAGEKLAGDPAWVLVVGGSGTAKTETLMPLASSGAVAVSTLSGEAALLSGTAKKDRAPTATGGLLHEIGSRGTLVLKDFTSILSMNRDTRALVLAALREIHDGSWSRNIGADGGHTLRWAGRLVVVGGVTTAWDSAHQVIATMGDRFVTPRFHGGNRDHRRAAGRQAMRNVNSEAEMRNQLSVAVSRLLDAVDPTSRITLSPADSDALLDVADLVTRCRTAVERDWKGNPAFAHGLEMPTRFAKQLVQLVQGGVALGMSREAAMHVALRAAHDSVPPLRCKVLLDIAAHSRSKTADVVKRTQQPRQTIDRTLQELHLLGLLVVDEEPYGETGRVRWVYSLAPTVTTETAETLRKFTRNVSTPSKKDHCTVCTQPLDTALIAARETTHPTCVKETI